MTKKTHLNIEGMHCASCAHTIEKNVKALEGVSKASVNYAAESAKVEFDPEKVGEEKIVEKIKDLGYNAFTQESVQDGGEKAYKHHQESKEKKIEILRNKLIL